MFDPSQPPLVQETLLKKRRSLDDLAFRRSVTVQQEVKRKRVVRGENIKLKRPEQLVRESRIKEGSRNKMQRRKREVERQSARKLKKLTSRKCIGFVVRIHAGRHSSPEIKAELQKLELNEKYDGKFIKLDEKSLDAYLAYGYLTHETVSQLLHRRAHTEYGGVKKPLTDNLTVETALGSKGLLCLNDMVEEIYNLRPNYVAALSLLTTFKLSSPVGHYEKTILHVHDDVETKGGFIGDEMDVFVNKIL